VDDSTGDTFSQVEQPSGHTASVMLPADSQMEGAMPAPTLVPFPMGRQGGTYAAVAARSNPKAATATWGAAIYQPIFYQFWTLSLLTLFS